MNIKLITLFALVSIVAQSNAQFERPRTRLQQMFQGFMSNMGNVASRLNSAMFPTRQRGRRPLPPRQQSQNINQFREVPEVSNDIEFDSSQHSEDQFFAPNSPNQHFPEHHEVQHQHQDRQQVGSFRVPVRQPLRNTPVQGFRNMVRNAMSRVRNLLPANRRRLVSRNPQRPLQNVPRQ